MTMRIGGPGTAPDGDLLALRSEGAGAQVRGVLEPVGVRPVIIEDEVLAAELAVFT